MMTITERMGITAILSDPPNCLQEVNWSFTQGECNWRVLWALLAANIKPLWVYFAAKWLQMWCTGSELKICNCPDGNWRVFSKVNPCKCLLTFSNRTFVTLSFFKRPRFSCVSLPLQVLLSLWSLRIAQLSFSQWPCPSSRGSVFLFSWIALKLWASLSSVSSYLPLLSPAELVCLSLKHQSAARVRTGCALRHTNT